MALRPLPLAAPARRVRAAVAFVAIAAACALGLGAPATAQHPPAPRASAAPGTGRPIASRCPWAGAAGSAGRTPQQLAAEVLAHMDLAEKLDLVVLRYDGAYQNVLPGLARLCIAPLVLEDGAAGIAYHSTGVTQLPAPLGVAASFDTSLAERYGRVEGEQARGKGIDVVQGPNLNLVRVPEDGRAYESYGEDPTLAADLGVAAVDGIQSAGVVAEATHLAAYAQETDRSSLDQIVSRRTLEEVYLAPFRAVVEDAHVGSLMCAYGEVDGVRDCQSGAILGRLSRWGFEGLLRSDLQAVNNDVSAFQAGVDAVKPASRSRLRQLVERHRLPLAVLDRAVSRILATMFTFHLVQHPLPERPGAPVATPADTRFALHAAEESMVLLRNEGGVLPLSPRTKSLALIGADAGTAAVTAGIGGAHVDAPFLSTPASAIASTVARASVVRVVGGGDPTAALPAIPAEDVRSIAVDLTASLPRSLTGALPRPRAFSPGLTAEAGAAKQLERELAAAGAVGTGTIPQRDFVALDRVDEVVVPPSSGLYAISLTDEGDAWLELDGRPLFSDPGIHFDSAWQVTARLQRGTRYTLTLSWWPHGLKGAPQIGWLDETPQLGRAVAAARASRVAVVFADALDVEGVDRPSLALPGDQDALISAVAAANPRTVVVLNTPGAVLMPWLHSVDAVLEAFYPGEEDGAATAAVLFGSFDPSGHLPVTIPASGDGVPGGGARAWPGVDDVVHFSEGLDIGYRYDVAHHVAPLFAFGYGLSYTTFSLGALSLRSSASGVSVEVPVTDTGSTAGAEVVQCYLSFPAHAGEPPIQLAAFDRVALQRGETKAAQLVVPLTGFEAYLHGRFRLVHGRFVLRVGTSSADLPLSATLRAP